MTDLAKAVPPNQGVLLNHEKDVMPGDKFKIVDDNGTELYINGIDDPLLVALAQAVDVFIVAHSTDKTTSEAAYGMLRTRFNDLPNRVKNKLGGYGVVIN